MEVLHACVHNLVAVVNVLVVAVHVLIQVQGCRGQVVLVGSWLSKDCCLSPTHEVEGLIQVRVRSLQPIKLCLVEHLLLHLVQVLNLLLVIHLIYKPLPVLSLVDAFREPLLVLSNEPLLIVNILHHLVVLHQLLIDLPPACRLLPCLVVCLGVELHKPLVGCPVGHLPVGELPLLHKSEVVELLLVKLLVLAPARFLVHAVLVS